MKASLTRIRSVALVSIIAGIVACQDNLARPDRLALSSSIGLDDACVPVPSGLVSWWPGDVDGRDVHGANHSSLLNGASAGAAAMVGGGFLLDGNDDFLEVPDSPSLNLPASITLMAWVKVTSFGVTTSNILSKGNFGGGGNESYALIINADRSAAIQLNSGRYPNRIDLNRIEIGGGPLTAGTWHHIAGTFDLTSGEISFYIDGQRRGILPNWSDAQVTGGLHQSDQPVLLGKAERAGSPYPTSYFPGLIDEAQVYNRALSAAEVQAIYDAGSAGLCGGPPPPPPTGLLAGFDLSRGGQFSLSSGDLLDELRAAIASSFDGMSYRPLAALGPGSLDGAELVLLTTAYTTQLPVTPLSSTEQAELLRFVVAGGCAVLLVDNDVSVPDATNESFIDSFGLDIGGTGFDAFYLATVANPTASPITSGPFGTVSSISQWYPGFLGSLGPYATSLASNGTGAALASIPPGALGSGSGPVIVFADINGIGDTAPGLFFQDHQSLWLNTISYCLNYDATPTADPAGPYDGVEGSPIAFDGTGSAGPAGSQPTYSWDFGDGSSGSGPTPSHSYNEDGIYLVSLTVTANGRSATATTTAALANAAPVLGAVVAPVDPRPVNTPIQASVSFSDAGVLDDHVAVFDWGTGGAGQSTGVVSEAGGSGAATAGHSYALPGVYTVGVTVTDDDGGSASASFQYIVVYDPSAGFVTGGGHIESPAGAYAPNPTLTGKASFAFVSKYLNGATVPTGNTHFKFKAAEFEFASTEYQWLVVAGAKAQYKGSGTIGGSGNYGFMLTVIDGALPGGGGVDRFRIKIWNQSSGGVIYDNHVGATDTSDPTTAIQGGSIVIHK